MKDVNELVQSVFSGLSPLVIEEVADEGERIVVRARTPKDAAVCPLCGASSGRVHGYQLRTVADVPVDGRRVVVRVRVRRLVCPTRGCCHTFREQMPGVLERFQRRTGRLTRQVNVVVMELAGRAGARVTMKRTGVTGYVHSSLVAWASRSWPRPGRDGSSVMKTGGGRPFKGCPPRSCWFGLYSVLVSGAARR